MTKKRAKRIASILLNAFFFTFLAICTLASILLVSAKKDPYGAAEILDHRLFIVTSDSMQRCEATPTEGFEIGPIPRRSMVLVESVPEGSAAADAWYASLKVGDVLTFRYVYDTQVTITHRLVSIRKGKDGGYILQLAGDNKAAEADTLYQTIDTSKKTGGNYVIGRVRGQCYPLGILISILQTKAGTVGIVIVPCAIIILLEVIKLAGLRAAAKQESTNAELRDLRRRLAELEAGKSTERTDQDAPHETEKKETIP